MTYRHRQSGLSLLIAMIVLVVMSMAAIGLIRSVDTGILTAGNLAFRQSATHAADAGIEAARTWLLDNAASLVGDSAANGYFATSRPGTDLTGNATPADANDDVQWGGNQTRCLAGQIAGNTVCFVIHRMCDLVGPLTATNCSSKPGALGGSSLGGTRQMQTYQQGSWASVTTIGYYRVTVRVAGPRNNVSFIQAYLTI